MTNFTVIKKNGKFHKTLAIDEAVKSIKDDNSIVFLTDLHLVVPNNMFESVRKVSTLVLYCIFSYMANLVELI